MSRDGIGPRALARIALLALVVTGPAVVSAQGSDRLPGRVEIAAGGGVTGASTLGSTLAALTPDRPGPGDPFAFFRTRTVLDGSPSVDVSLGVDVSRRFGIEGRLTYRRPSLSVAITDDAERASGAGTISERVSEYLVDVSVVFSLRRWTFAGGRAVPFVHGGAGYLRHLHQGRVLLETGTTGHLGGGVRILLAEPDALVRGVGVRAQAALSLRAGGVEIDEGVQKIIVASGGMFVRF